MAPSRFSLLTAALLAAGLPARAQLTPVTVIGRNAPAADLMPFGDVPLKDVPASLSVITRQQIEDAGARRLADLTRFDPSINDAYNAPGYWDFLSIRGFTLDNRFNYRREGLPISAETVIPLDNKERVEVLKGTSGIQAGTSAPGGLVNYVVKRPTESDVQRATLEVTQRSSLLAAVDIGARVGAFGYRLNIAQERLRPEVRNLDGQRALLALAGDWRFGGDTLLEGELEWSRQRQPSQSGFSLLGATLPVPADPRANLNRQPWLRTSTFDAVTGTLRFSQPLAADLSWSAQLGTQRLKSDDYTAFPFGCGAEGNFDRFCSDGTFDYYDFRSEDERRRQDAAQVTLKGILRSGAIRHDVSASLLASRVRHRFQLQAFNWVGIGHIDGTAVVPPDASQAFFVPDRDERSVELSIHAASRWSNRLTTWMGMRLTRLDRGYDQSVTTPWVAVNYKLANAVAYASWGQGVESHQVSANPVYALANAGRVLPAARSRQWEAGLKADAGSLAWQLAAFRIERPMTNFDFCTRTFSCSIGEYDGEAVHKGIEANGRWTHGPWLLSGGLTLLGAKREGSVYESASNGRRPSNVPGQLLRATATYRVPSMPLELEAHVSHEGKRPVLADGSVSLPSWTRVDAALRYKQRIGPMETNWTLGVQNLLDRGYWREAPFQFGHVYLYPGAARTVRLAFTATL